MSYGWADGVWDILVDDSAFLLYLQLSHPDCTIVRSGDITHTRIIYKSNPICAICSVSTSVTELIKVFASLSRCATAVTRSCRRFFSCFIRNLFNSCETVFSASQVSLFWVNSCRQCPFSSARSSMPSTIASAKWRHINLLSQSSFVDHNRRSRQCMSRVRTIIYNVVFRASVLVVTPSA